MRRPATVALSAVIFGTLLTCAVSRVFSDPADLKQGAGRDGIDLRHHDEFRTYDGSANNPNYADWGRVGGALLRHMLAPHYADGAGAPDVTGMPSARAVSNAVVAQPVRGPNAAGVSDMFWQWGQFLDHDLDLTPAMLPAEAFDIAVPAGDPMFDPTGSGAMSIPFERSEYAMFDGVREQMNRITAYIDAGNVYGSDAARARELRALDGSGRLKVSAGRLLPYNVNGFPNAPSSDPGFFLAGDVRANEQVGLTALHTLFVREHNWVVTWLRRQAPHWTAEQLYQTARAIVGAEIQVVTVQEFLPLLLGPDALGPYEGYRHDVNPGIDNAFSTAAYRLGHSMVSDVLLRLKRDGEPIAEGNLPLAESFFAPERISAEGGIEPILRGLATQAAQEIDPFIVDGLRNFLFGPPGAGGFDLAALNIQRGRDHGMKRYNDCRRAVGLAPCASFADVSSDPLVQARLGLIYDDVDEIDLWVGGLAEDHMPGAMVGELFHAILSDQFVRLRHGDRFWYANDFKPWMVRWLESQTLAGIIRRNTSIGKEIQDAVFVAPTTLVAQVGDVVGGVGADATERESGSTGRGERIEAFPNPARVGTGVWLELPTRMHGIESDVAIYDARGRRVRQLHVAAGASPVFWDGRTHAGHPAQSGIYFMRVRAGANTLQRRVLLLD